MAALPDYYEVLQVHPAAEPEVIQAAYRRLSLKYHPDVYHGGDAQRRMAQLNGAYAVLGNTARRAAYDAQRAGPASRRAVHPTPPTPTPQATPRELDLGAIGFGRTRTATVRVRNTGGGRMSGFVVSHVPWLRVTPSEFNSNDLDVNILFRPDRTGAFASPRALEVYSNGGRITIGVRAEVSPTHQPPAARRETASPSTTARLTRRPSYHLAKPPPKGVRVPFSVWVIAGMVLSGVIWFQIAPLLAVLPVGLGLYLLWDHSILRRGKATPRTTATTTGLTRCSSCGAAVMASAAARCSRCGGSVCPACGACVCRAGTGARRQG